MAKGKATSDETPRPQKGGTGKGAARDKKTEKTPPDDIQEINDSGGDGGNPEWWRGDPGKRGEVL